MKKTFGRGAVVRNTVIFLFRLIWLQEIRDSSPR